MARRERLAGGQIAIVIDSIDALRLARVLNAARVECSGNLLPQEMDTLDSWDEFIQPEAVDGPYELK